MLTLFQPCNMGSFVKEDFDLFIYFLAKEGSIKTKTEKT